MKKLIRENMSNHLISIGLNEGMETAFNRMRDNNVRHLPVLSAEGEIIGMLSDRDVQRSMISTIEHEHRRRLVSESIVFDPETRVSDYMSWPVEVVDQHSSVRNVAQRMVQEKISSFLVCHGEKIVGIVTTEDLLKVLIDLLDDTSSKSHWTLDHLLESTSKQMQNILV